MNILNLDEFDITATHEGPHEYTFAVTPRHYAPFCPKCGVVEAKSQKFGTKELPFRDLPMHGKRVMLVVHRQRYRCLECRSTFYEALFCVDERRAITERLSEWVAQQSLKRTFVDIAGEVGLDEKTVRNILHDWIAVWEKRYHRQTPRYMGIDEIHLIGKPRAVITNVEERTVVDLLEDRSKEFLGRYLTNLADRDKVEIVTMDMWKPYKELANALMPQAVVVVDKFHVIRMATGALDQIRRNIGKDMTSYQRRQLMRERSILLKRQRDLNTRQAIALDGWLGNVPMLAEAHAIKEAFVAIWDVNTRSDATRLYSEWLTQVATASRPVQDAFKPLFTALQNWNNEIFNYWDYPVTNAYTEALNGLIRVVNRMGRGYSIEVLRAKLLFNFEAQKRVAQSSGYRDAITRMGGMSAFPAPDPIAGADMSKLAELIAAGRLEQTHSPPPFQLGEEQPMPTVKDVLKDAYYGMLNEILKSGL